jgi:CDP-paratose 2-epimerase
MVEEYHASYGLHTIVNRCGVIAGPWQMGKVDQGVVVLWMARHFWQKPLQYIGFGGTGLQVRDVLHIHDLFRLVDHQIHDFEPLNGQTFNVGGGLASSASLQELTQLCRQITGHTVNISQADTDRPGDIPLYITDNRKITAATGWQPQLTTTHLLQDVYNWLRAEQDGLKAILGI